MMLKLSAESLKAIGATSEANADAAFAATITALKASAEAVTDLKTKLVAAEAAATEAKTGLDAANKTIAAQAKQIEALEAKVGNPAAITEANVKSWATEAGKVEGSRVALEAIAKTGSGAPPAPPSASASENAGVAALIAAGKYDEAFAADKKIQAEFTTKEAYAAYMRNAHRVSVKGANR